MQQYARLQGLRRFKRGANGIVLGIEADVRIVSLGGGGMHEVLGGAAEALVEVAVVGIDHGAAPGKIRKNGDRPVLHAKFPGLGVVTGGRQRGEPDQLPHVESSVAAFLTRPALRCGGGLVRRRTAHGDLLFGSPAEHKHESDPA
jgi:hypothetical protein